jgi:hypothetical protein
MNKAKEADEVVELDLIDLIADDLTPELRASYYREMRHCQSLPKNDEVLRMIRVIQVHCQFAVKIPGQIAVERKTIEQAFASALKNLQENLQSSKAYQEQLDRHLIYLPNRIAEDINPATIVAKINEIQEVDLFPTDFSHFRISHRSQSTSSLKILFLLTLEKPREIAFGSRCSPRSLPTSVAQFFCVR